MGLKALRHERLMNEYFEHPRSSERGGVLTIHTVSGIDYADYSPDPSGFAVLGIKLNDHWYTEFNRQPDPTRIRRVSTIDGLAKIVYRGEIITDWVHPDYTDSIQPGDIAYVGPSGLLVNDQSFAGNKVGRFLSTVGATYYGLAYHDSYTVYWYGLGLEYTWTNPDTKEIEHVNPLKISLSVGGWVKLRVDTKPEA